MARQSKIIIAKNIRIDKEYKEVLNYTESQMLSLVETNAVATALDYSFIRDKGTISTNFTYSQCLQCNYIAFQNKDYDNKWFFAWLDDVRYVNDGCTEISYTIDAWSTWFDKLNVGSSFVIREHVNDDTVGKNILPENLETGEYVMDNIVINEELQDVCPVISTNYEPITETDNKGIYMGNIYQGYGFYVVKSTISTEYYASDQIGAINDFMVWLAGKGKADTVLSLFMAPRKLAGWDVTQTWKVFSLTGSVKTAGYDDDYTIPYTFNNMTVTKPTTIDGYTPKNKKLLTYPYCYLNLNNNSGNIANFHYEDFSNNTITFNIKGVLAPGCSIRAIPTNYKKVEYNYTYGLNLGKYPICSWNSDVYINWLTQNAVNIPLSFASGVVSTATGVVSGSAVGTASGVLSIASSVGSIYEHSLNPVQTEGNLNSGDINVGDNRNTFTLEQMNIKSQFAKVIDEYFSRYGYKVNENKIPNITGRTYWNYIQIAESENLGYGEIPQKFLDEINKIARQGTTIWHSHNNIGNYSLNNAIVTP